jgi:hypothetical protein
MNYKISNHFDKDFVSIVYNSLMDALDVQRVLACGYHIDLQDRGVMECTGNICYINPEKFSKQCGYRLLYSQVMDESACIERNGLVVWAIELRSFLKLCTVVFPIEEYHEEEEIAS